MENEAWPWLPISPPSCHRKIERRKRSRVIKRVIVREDQEDEALDYWMTRSPDERVQAALVITEMALSARGPDANRLGRSERTLTRIQRERR